MEVDEKNSASDLHSSGMATFKDLRKATMTETYQNLHKLIGKKDENYENMRKLISSEPPLPLFDECLRLNLIDCLKLEEEVVKILLSQNDQQIKRILGCKWFFENLPFDFCTSELFPYVSVSVRNKIICKLSKHLQKEDEAEKYFAFVRRNYDYQRADYLLPKCSSQFILKHFQMHKSLLNHPSGLRLLLVICRRYPDVGFHIMNHDFEKKKDAYELRKYKCVLLYLAGNHSNLFVPFLRKHHLLLEHEMFGRKVTKKLGPLLQEDFVSGAITTSPFKFKFLFEVFPLETRVKCVASHLGYHKEEGVSLNSWEYSTYKLSSILELLEPKDRLVMVERVFHLLYDLNFKNNSKYWNRDLLELLPLDVRKFFVTKIEKYFDGDEKTFEKNVGSGFYIGHPQGFIHLLEFSSAFERFKNMIKNSPMPSTRMEIMNQMVKNCGLNSDVEGLQEVVDFVVKHSRNDDRKILYSFIDEILHRFSWSALTSSTYERLNELFHLCTLRGDVNWHWYKRWKERYIFHLLENGRDVDEHVKSYFENILNNCYDTFLTDYNCRHSKTLLLALCGEALRWIRNNASEKADMLYVNMVRSCNNFNAARPGGQIWSEVPGLEEFLLEKLRARYKEAGADAWSLDVWKRYPEDVEKSFRDPRCLLYVLMRKPDFVETHLEGIVHCLISACNDYNTRKTFKSYFSFAMKAASFFGKVERVKELLLEEFKAGDSVERRKAALLLYSQVSTIEEFGRAVQEYLPRQEKVETQPGLDFGKIQLSIPSLIRNVRPRWRNFELIFKFFMGDFLKRVRPTLHACCLHTRVDVVIPLLKKRFGVLPPKISYQKDVVRLIAELSTRSERLDFCVEFWDQHKHYSMRSILFYQLTRLFVEEPTRESFRAVEKFVLESDNVTITKMPKLEDVPDEFVDEYVRTLMLFSEGQPPAFRNSFQNSTLKHFTSNRIKFLSLDFCERIIQNNLFNEDANLDVTEFASFYLTDGPGTVEGRARTIFNNVEEKKPDPRYLCNLVQSLRERALKEPLAFADLFAILVENWPKYLVAILYEDRVLFTYVVLYQRAFQRSLDEGQIPSEFAKELKKLYSSVENLKDLAVVYGEALKKFLACFEAAKALSVIEELVKASTDRTVAVVGITALPEYAVTWYWSDDRRPNEAAAKKKKMVDDLVQVLEAYGDEIVEIYLRRKFVF